jgi:AraC-like DNA-binding protein
MDSSPRPVATPPASTTDFCLRGWGVLGHVVSECGVQLLATHGIPHGKTVNQITPTTWSLGYSLNAPRDIAIGRRGRFQSTGHLNFYSPDTPFELRASGPMTLSMCFLSEHFLAGLSEAESGFKLGHLDLLSDIQSERLVYLGRAIFREATRPGFASSLFAEAIGMEIALELARYDGACRPDDETRRIELTSERMRRLETYVRDHLAEKLSLSEVALELGMSVRHLSRAVRQAKGTSLHRWISDCRLAEAHRLLADTDLPIQDIALRCAFENTCVFSTAFLVASGWSPSEFRRLISGSSRHTRPGFSGGRDPEGGVP